MNLLELAQQEVIGIIESYNNNVFVKDFSSINILYELNNIDNSFIYDELSEEEKTIITNCIESNDFYSTIVNLSNSQINIFNSSEKESINNYVVLYELINSLKDYNLNNKIYLNSNLENLKKYIYEFTKNKISFIKIN